MYTLSLCAPDVHVQGKILSSQVLDMAGMSTSSAAEGMAATSGSSAAEKQSKLGKQSYIIYDCLPNFDWYVYIYPDSP